MGSLCSFLVGIISPMILSRYFDKADYGTYKQVMYVYNTLLTVFTLGLPKAYSYFLPKFEVKYSREIINKITRLFWILGIAFSLLLFFCSQPISKLLGNPDLSEALRYFAVVPLFMLPTMGLDSICASFQRTQILAIYTIITKVFTILCITLPVIVWKGNYIQAIIGFDIASAISCCLALYIKNKLTYSGDNSSSPLTLKEIFAFSLPLLYASLWGMIISSSTQLFVSRYYGTDVFADFSNGFMEIPFVGMIIGAVATVLLPAFSKMDNGDGMNQETLSLWTSSMIKSAKIIFPMLCYSIFFATTIMTCMYGSQYSSSSSYFIIKCISGLFYIVPFAPIILAIGKTKDYARVHMIIAIIIIFVEYLTVKTIDSPIAVSIAGEICNILKVFLMSVIISRYAKLSMMTLFKFKSLIKIFLCGFSAAVLTNFIYILLPFGKFVVLFTSILVYITLYSIICRIFKISYKEMVEPVMPQSFKAILKIIP